MGNGGQAAHVARIGSSNASPWMQEEGGGGARAADHDAHVRMCRNLVGRERDSCGACGHPGAARVRRGTVQCFSILVAPVLVRSEMRLQETSSHAQVEALLTDVKRRLRIYRGWTTGVQNNQESVHRDQKNGNSRSSTPPLPNTCSTYEVAEGKPQWVVTNSEAAGRDPLSTGRRPTLERAGPSAERRASPPGRGRRVARATLASNGVGDHGAPCALVRLPPPPAPQPETRPPHA